MNAFERVIFKYFEFKNRIGRCPKFNDEWWWQANLRCLGGISFGILELDELSQSTFELKDGWVSIKRVFECWSWLN